MSTCGLRLQMFPGGLARLWLSRPAMRNAFDDQLVGALSETFASLPDEARVVIIAGEGPTFSAGADLAWMKRCAGYDRARNVDDARALGRMFDIIDRCPKAVIGQVHGAALGGGAGIVACCDIVVADRATLFGFTEVRLGLVPAVIAPFVIRKIGSSAARRYFLTGERFDAATAADLGLVHEITDGDEARDDTVDRIATALLQSGPEAIAATKKLIREVPSLQGHATLEATASVIASRRVSSEGQEGLAAFLEGRQPRFAWPPP